MSELEPLAVELPETLRFRAYREHTPLFLRPKTEEPDTLALTTMTEEQLDAWWEEAGQIDRENRDTSAWNEATRSRWSVTLFGSTTPPPSNGSWFYSMCEALGYVYRTQDTREDVLRRVQYALVKETNLQTLKAAAQLARQLKALPLFETQNEES